MTPITINGAVVDAAVIIDALVAQIAEQALTIAVLRAECASWSALAHAHVVDGAPTGEQPSESRTEADPGTPADSTAWTTIQFGGIPADNGLAPVYGGVAEGL